MNTGSNSHSEATDLTGRSITSPDVETLENVLRDRILCFIGRPACGKGTCLRSLAAATGSRVSSMSKLIEQECAKEGQIAEDKANGRLIADDRVIPLAEKEVHKAGHEHGFILDGFPRTRAQAEWLAAQSKAGAILPPILVVIEVPPEVSRERMRFRAQNAVETRADDNEATFETRLKLYDEHINAILGLFKDSVVAINGSQTPEEVWAETRQKLAGFSSGH